MPNKKINELSPRTPSLTDLMIVGDPSTGYSYKATITALTAFVGNNLQFANLGGISLTNPVNGQVLQFNGTSWVNYTPSTWNTAYDRSLVSVGVSGTTTKTITLTKQDGSTLTASWSDLNTDAVTSVFGRTGAVVAAEGDYSLTQLSDVTLSTPSTNQVLQYNGTAWVNGTISVPVTSVFGRTGNVVATEGDYTLTQLGDVTLTTPSTNQVLQYNGTAWVNATLTDNGITSLNGLTALTQTFAVGSSGTDFGISSTTSTHTFNLPTASATNRGALSSADWSTFNAKQNAITLTTTGSSGSATLVGATLNIPTYTLAGLGGVSGSGTTNYLSKWTSSSALGNSLLFDNSTLGNVGINTSSPASTLEIYKSTGTNYLYVTNGTSGTLNGVVLRWNSVDYMGMIGNFNSGEFKVGGFNASGYFMTFYSNNAERMRLTPSGRLLIGTSTESTYLLDVSGTFRSTLDANINGLTVGRGGGSVATSTAVGYQVLNATATADGSVGVGYRALRSVTSGTMNVGLGFDALYSVNTGAYNIGIGGNRVGDGTSVLYSLTSGSYNVGIGHGALRATTTGTYNIGIGFASGYELTTGQLNIFLGHLPTTGITTGNYNTIVGSQVTGLSASLSNTIILADGQGNQRLVAFNDGNVYIGGSTSLPTNSGYKLDVNGTARVSGTELRLDNGTTGTLNIYSATPVINFFSLGGYTIGRSGTTMTWNSGGSINLQIGGNGGYQIDGANGHVFRSAITGGAALARLDTGGSLSIGNGSTAANASSILDLTSITKGFLPPRMTNAQMTAIATPATGLIVYDTTNNKVTVYNGTAWTVLH